VQRFFPGLALGRLNRLKPGTNQFWPFGKPVKLPFPWTRGIVSAMKPSNPYKRMMAASLAGNSFDRCAINPGNSAGRWVEKMFFSF